MPTFPDIELDADLDHNVIAYPLEAIRNALFQARGVVSLMSFAAAETSELIGQPDITRSGQFVEKILDELFRQLDPEQTFSSALSDDERGIVEAPAALFRLGQYLEA